MKERSKFKKGLERILESGIIAVGSLIGNVNASPGDIEVKNYLNSDFENVNILRDDTNFSGAKDGIDTHDTEAMEKPYNLPNTYFDIITHLLWGDYRPEDSNTPYNQGFGFNGTLTENKSNWLNFAFPYGLDWSFGNAPIIFQQTSSSDDPTGTIKFYPVYDVRRAIAKNGGIVPLEEVTAGTYDQWTPYGNGVLEIGTRILADLDDKSKVNLRDYAILAADFGKPKGQYTGDIVGPNGIPDGYVDGHDLGVFTKSWLADVNDPNTW